MRFDIPRIREAFAEIGRDPPEPKGTIDSLVLLTQKFGRRAGDMKVTTMTLEIEISSCIRICWMLILLSLWTLFEQMATLATYFGIGNQTHRYIYIRKHYFALPWLCSNAL